MTKAETIVANWHAARRVPPFVTDFKAMRGDGSLDAAMQVYDEATEAERKLIKSEMRGKLSANRAKPDQWSKKTRKLAMLHFRMSPDPK